MPTTSSSGWAKKGAYFPYRPPSMRTMRKSQKSTYRRLRFERNKAMRLSDRAADREWIDGCKERGYNTPMHYILRGKEVVAVRGLIRWARWFETNSRKVGSDYVGDVRVSTVFLGLDHGYFGPRPVLFETMTFDKNDKGGGTRRYETWDEARAGHEALVAKLQSRLIEENQSDRTDE